MRRFAVLVSCLAAGPALVAEPILKDRDPGAHVIEYETMRLLAFEWNAPPSYPEVRRQKHQVLLRFQALAQDQTRVVLWASARASSGRTSTPTSRGRGTRSWAA